MLGHRTDETCYYEEDFTIRNFNKMMDGKVVVVIGASYGMGKKMIQLMVKQGIRVFVTAHGKEELDVATADIKEKVGGDITGITTDSLKPKERKKTFEGALETYGDIDVLVNNVDKGEFVIIDVISDEVTDQIVDTNVKGPLYLYREVVGYPLKKDSKSVISISSANDIRSMRDAAYCATKGGSDTLTKNAAIRYTDTGVHYNAVAPGHTPSPTVYIHDDGGPQTLAEGAINEVRDICTVRSVHPWEIDQARVVLSLASDISCCTNGEVLSVDCGCYLQ